MQISEEQAQEVTVHERRIEDRRRQMTDTMSELQDRLSPGTIAGNAGNAVKEATVGRSGRLVSQVTERIKENPVPAALIGAGVAWMLMGGKKQDGAGDYYYSRGLSPSQRAGGRLASAGQGMTGQAREAVGGAADQVSDVARNVAGQVSDGVGNIAGTARMQAGRLGDRGQQMQGSIRRLVEENPLPVALTAAGLGALIATALPTTDAEERVMEPVGAQISEQARNLGTKVGEMAQQAERSVREQTQQ